MTRQERLDALTGAVRRLLQQAEGQPVLKTEWQRLVDERDAAIAERDALARAASLVEGTLKAEMDAHRRTISERDAARQEAAAAQAQAGREAAPEALLPTRIREAQR